MKDPDLNQDLLAWYDRNARTMPWRTSPANRAKGVIPDPYRVWMSEVMLQQTTVASVKAYFEKFTSIWPTVTDLANAADADVMAAWAGLGYYARARNLLKCARVVASEMGGVFPGNHDDLLKLPGVGPYTAAAIASIAYDEAAVVVDGNVERVMARLHDVHTPLPTAKAELTALAATLTPTKRPGDYAQAVMDLGATLCTPRNPACGICPWNHACDARANGTQADLPKKLPKTPKPTRLGTAYVAVRRDGAVLLEQRPDKGLLGGMMGWPGTDLTEELPAPAPPIRADWQMQNTQVRHTFTHFHLVLDIALARDVDTTPDRGAFVDLDTFNPGGLPTVMRKVWDMIAKTA